MIGFHEGVYSGGDPVSAFGSTRFEGENVSRRKKGGSGDVLGLNQLVRQIRRQSEGGF